MQFYTKAFSVFTIIEYIFSILLFVSSLFFPITELIADTSFFCVVVILRLLALINVIIAVVLTGILLFAFKNNTDKFHNKFIVYLIVSVLLIHVLCFAITFASFDKQEIYTEENNADKLISQFDKYYPYYLDFNETDKNVITNNCVYYEKMKVLGNEYMHLQNIGSIHAEGLEYDVEFTNSKLAGLFSPKELSNKADLEGIDYAIINNNDYYGQNSTTILIKKEDVLCRYTVSGEGMRNMNYSTERIVYDAIKVLTSYLNCKIN